MIELDAKSRAHLDEVHGDLRAVILRAAELSDVKFTVTDGVRTMAEQLEHFRKGNSKTTKSRHLTGHAVDLLAFKNGKDAWQLPEANQVAAFRPVADAVKVAASELGVPIEWGYDLWGWDAPHFQLPWSEYPEGREISHLDQGHGFKASRFNALVGKVLDTEGEWNAADPSMRGVTLETYKRWRPDGTIDDLKSLTPEKAKTIYRALYWHPAGCDDLPAGLDYAVFDFAIHSGVDTAVAHLQDIIGTTPDGIFGANTRAAVSEIDDLPDVINKLMDSRLSRMKTLPNWPANKGGWQSRVSGVREESLAMTMQEPEPEPQQKTALTLADYDVDSLAREIANRTNVKDVRIVYSRHS